MKLMKLMKLALTLLALSPILSGGVIGVTLNSTAGMVSIFSIGPDEITIQTGTNQYSTVPAWEYYLRPTPGIGQGFEAQEFTLQEASVEGEFSLLPSAFQDYELVIALSSETPATSLGDLNLQEALWDVFEPGAFPVNPVMSQDYVTAFAAEGTLNFANYSLIEPIESDNGVPPFVAFTGAATVVTPPVVTTPEPLTEGMIGIGLLMIGWTSRRRKMVK